MEDAWIPFAFAGINLVSSIILAKSLGVAGVFLGTIVGSLLTADWYRPIIIYRYVFHAPVSQYYKKYLMYVFLGFAYLAAAYGLCSLVQTSVLLVDFIIKCVIAAAFPVLMNVLLFYRTKEFAATKELCHRLLDGVRSKFMKTAEKKHE